MYKRTLARVRLLFKQTLGYSAVKVNATAFYQDGIEKNTAAAPSPARCRDVHITHERIAIADAGISSV